MMLTVTLLYFLAPLVTHPRADRCLTIHVAAACRSSDLDAARLRPPLANPCRCGHRGLDGHPLVGNVRGTRTLHVRAHGPDRRGRGPMRFSSKQAAADFLLSLDPSTRLHATLTIRQAPSDRRAGPKRYRPMALDAEVPLFIMVGIARAPGKRGTADSIFRPISCAICVVGRFGRRPRRLRLTNSK